MTTPKDVEAALRWQVDWCRKLGSPFTSKVLDLALEDYRAHGPVYDLLASWKGPAIEDALALRFTGVLHHLVLAGKAPALAAQYPAATDTPDWQALKAAMLEALEAHALEIKNFLTRPVQTNEIGRSNCLLPGFISLAERTGAPFHLREIGASGGLNMVWDKFHYDFGNGQKWGDMSSPVQLSAAWTGPRIDLMRLPQVASRKGVDINPLDLSTPEAITRASVYIWPDQTQRLARFRAAADIIRQEKITVEKGDAALWLERELETRPARGAFVLYHSIMWQYMPPETQNTITELMESAGQTATAAAPLAWLRLEPRKGDGLPELRLQFWDGDTAENTQLAWCHPHGAQIEWLAA